MITVNITQDQVNQAEAKAIELGRLRNSITEGEGNMIGFLGEIIVANFFDGIIQNTYDYDIIISNKRVDVKTKKTTVKPESYYFASVAAYNITQKCDSYYFVRIDLANMIGYLLGGLSKKSFFKKATFNRRGEVDSSSSFGWTFKADCYNLSIDKLKNPEAKKLNN
jgi:hypothetical protein